MTTTYQPSGDLAPRNDARSRRGSATALAGGSLLAAAALSMHLRGGVENVEFVRRVEDAPGLWLTGHVLMAVGGVLLVLGLIAVPGLAHGRGHRAVAIGAGLSAVGAASTASEISRMDRWPTFWLATSRMSSLCRSRNSSSPSRCSPQCRCRVFCCRSECWCLAAGCSIRERCPHRRPFLCWSLRSRFSWVT